MTANNEPTQVATIIELTRRYLAGFEKELNFVDYIEGPQPAWTYVVEEVDYPTEIFVHQTRASLNTPSPKFRVRMTSTISGELGEWFNGKEAVVNRFASLGAMTVHANKTASVASQFVITENNLNVCSALLAAAAVHSASSLVQSVALSMNPTEDPVNQVSSWSDLDFECIAYNFGHLGVGEVSRLSWRLVTLYGTVELTAVHNNPYWQGGLLCLNSASKEQLGISGKALIEDMNALDWLTSDVPSFGGWCEVDQNVVYVSFLPNFFKDIPDLIPHLVSWGRKRLAAAPELVRAAEELRQNDDQV